MLVPNRHKAVDDGYRYGFNDMEKDDEIKGEGNSYDFGARMYDPRVGRWFRLDPLSVKYPYEGNYNAFGNNPILYIDNDGRDIIIHLSNGNTIKYKPGMKVPDDKFGKKVVETLNSIHSTGEGEIVVKALSESQKSYNIKQADVLFPRTPREKAEKSRASFALGENGEKDKKFLEYIEKKDYSKAQDFLANTDQLFIGAFDGNYNLAWKKGGNDPDNVKMNFELTLAHELFHGYQFEIGNLNGLFLALFTGETNSGVTLIEAQTVGFENYIRATLFGDTKYGTTRANYSGPAIDEFFEEPDWWDHIIGYDRLEVKEFKEGGKGYKLWKEGFTKKAETIRENILKKNDK